MKKLFITLLLIACGVLSEAQVSVENSTLGIQTGFLGLWINNEFKLSNKSVMRAELGFDSGFWTGSLYEKSGYIFSPVLTLEPRIYYNLKKRYDKSKRIDGNRGNFIAIKSSYHPDWFVISNYDDISVISDLLIIPTWGIRRLIGNHFNYEAGIGIGYQYIFYKQAGLSNNEGGLALNLHLRIGYTF